jgi:hypothetical protein
MHERAAANRREIMWGGLLLPNKKRLVKVTYCSIHTVHITTNACDDRLLTHHFLSLRSERPKPPPKDKNPCFIIHVPSRRSREALGNRRSKINRILGCVSRKHWPRTGRVNPIFHILPHQKNITGLHHRTLERPGQRLFMNLPFFCFSIVALCATHSPCAPTSGCRWRLRTCTSTALTLSN